jgi:alanine transaminase
VLSDEVYQENIYDDKVEFISAKQAAFELGLLENDDIELASFHSTSKGLMGECGHRGGYVELVGFDKKIKEHFYKLASSRLCSNVDGQILMDLMVRGPRPSDESYERHEAEKAEILGELKRKAKLMADGLNAIPGFSCQPAQGSMYCFPRIEMPPKAIQAAKDAKTTPDTLYALSLLESTGICVVPASGFGQKPGRYGFRTTFLPPEAEMKAALKKFRKHHEAFCRKYAD